MVPAKPLPLLVPVTVDDLPGAEQVRLDFAAGLVVRAFAIGETEFDEVDARLDIGLGIVTGDGFRKTGLLALPNVTCTAR